jgi:hypothetical protein
MMRYLFELLVDGIISETFKFNFVLCSIEVLPQKILNFGLLDDPAGDYLLLFFFLHDDVGCINLFFLEFADWRFFVCFEVGLFFVAESMRYLLVDIDEFSISLFLLFLLLLFGLILD